MWTLVTHREFRKHKFCDVFLIVVSLYRIWINLTGAADAADMWRSGAWQQVKCLSQWRAEVNADQLQSQRSQCPTAQRKTVPQRALYSCVCWSSLFPNAVFHLVSLPGYPWSTSPPSSRTQTLVMTERMMIWWSIIFIHAVELLSDLRKVHVHKNHWKEHFRWYDF